MKKFQQKQLLLLVCFICFYLGKFFQMVSGRFAESISPKGRFAENFGQNYHNVGQDFRRNVLSAKRLKRLSVKRTITLSNMLDTDISKKKNFFITNQAQCLHTITDDNSDIYSQFEQNPQYIRTF